MKDEINILKEENKKLKELIDKHEIFIEQRITQMKKEEEEREKIKEEENNFIKNNIEVEFKDDPKYLKFSETLTKNNKKGNGNFIISIYLFD